MTECCVCTELCNKRRKASECPHCHIIVCSECFKKYAVDHISLENRGTQCCGCRQALSFDFVVEATSKSWVQRDWLKRRKQLLMEWEMTRMPATQTLIVEMDHLKAFITQTEQQLEPHREQLRVLNRESRQLFNTLLQLNRRITDHEDMWRRPRDPTRDSHSNQFAKTLDDLVRERDRLLGEQITYQERIMQVQEALDHSGLPFLLQEANDRLRRLQNDAMRGQEHTPHVNPSSLKCPENQCLGYLDSELRCGMCSLKLCPACYEIQRDNLHQCNPDQVETLRLILRDSKPCPQCGISISKVDGCDQMWCVSCKTAFSWVTGQKETGRIHNPEYFRWMREHGQHVPVTQEACDIPNLVYVIRLLRHLRLIDHMYGYTVLDFFRQVEHLLAHRAIQRPFHRNLVHDRIRFLKKGIDKETFESVVFASDRQTHRGQFVYDMNLLFVDVGYDLLRRTIKILEDQSLPNPHTDAPDALDAPDAVFMQGIIEEMHQLVSYYNEQVERFVSNTRLPVTKLPPLKTTPDEVDAIFN